jgi:multiple sugar transport system substrate-binding protein
VILTKHNHHGYLTATLAILPVLVLLAACQSSPQSTASVAVTSTHTLAAMNSTPLATHATLASTSTTLAATATTCKGSGCYTPTPTRTPTHTPTSSLGAEPVDLRGLTLQFWYVAQAGDAGGVLPVLVSEFNKSNSWGLRIEITAFDSPGLLSEKVRNTLYSGDLPDVLAGYSYQVTSWDKNAKTLVDLNTYLDDFVWGLPVGDYEAFYPSFWQQVNPGKRLSIPLHRNAIGLYYNLTWAKELGYTAPPKTAQEFEEQACAAAKEKESGIGGWMITPETSTLVGWMYAFGGSLVNPNGKGYLIDTPENLQALTFLKGLQTQGCAWTTTELYPHAEFAQREALFVVGSTTGIASQVAAFQSAGTGDQWTVIPFPQDANSSVPFLTPVVIAHGPDLMLTRTTVERQLAAWLFTRWLISPEVQSRWVVADGSLPLRAATLDLLSDYAKTHPQWKALAGSLVNIRNEPEYPSWEIVRWVFSDAAAQLFSTNYRSDGIPDLLKMLEKTANEANVQVR